MKYTNIKKLLIKFMGGGLINFPTRFLRWIKIDGDAEGDDGGGGGGEVKFLDEMLPEEYAKTRIFKDDSENAVYPNLFLGIVDDSEDATAISATTAEEYFEKLEDAYYELYGYEIEHEQMYGQYHPLVGYSSVPEGQPTVFSQTGEPLFNSFQAIPIPTDTGQAYIMKSNFE